MEMCQNAPAVIYYLNYLYDQHGAEVRSYALQSYSNANSGQLPALKACRSMFWIMSIVSDLSHGWFALQSSMLSLLTKSMEGLVLVPERLIALSLVVLALPAVSYCKWWSWCIPV